MTKKSFLKGAAILGIAGIFIKILGAVYRIPLGNLLKTEGMGYYQTSYPIYNMLYAISTAGLPVAVAKIIAEKRALGDYQSAKKVFNISFIGLMILGIIVSSIVFLFGGNIVNWLNNPNAYYALVAMTPALLFAPMTSALRGYFQGHQNMIPTALSQVFEQLVRIVVGYTLAYTLLSQGLEKATGGATFGASAGSVAAFLVVFLMYLMNRKKLEFEIAKQSFKSEETTKSLMKKIIVIALPIALGAIIVPLMNTFDLKIIMTRLQSAGYTADEANALWGQLSGFAQTFINFPQVLAISLAVSVVPAVSEAYALKDNKKMQEITNGGLRTIIMIGLPCAFGLFILATPIIQLLYYKLDIETQTSIGSILAMLSFSVIFLTVVQALTAVLQGIGKTIVPVINLIIGGLVKIILSYVLIGIPSINIYGAVISTIAAYAIAATLDYIAVKKYTKTKFNIKQVFFKPFIATIMMTLTAWIVYNGAVYINGKLATLMAILSAVIVYVVFIIVLQAITKEELNHIPMGAKIVKTFERLKLI